MRDRDEIVTEASELCDYNTTAVAGAGLSKLCVELLLDLRDQNERIIALLEQSAHSPSAEQQRIDLAVRGARRDA